MITISLISCAIKNNKKTDFSNTALIYSKGVSNLSSNEALTMAIVDAQKNAVKSVFEIFYDNNISDNSIFKFLMDNYSIYVKKYKIEEKKISDNYAEVNLKIYFLIDKFLETAKKENLSFSGKPKIGIFPKFYSSYNNTLNKFKSVFINNDSYQFYISDIPFEESKDLDKFDYIVLSDIYSYSLNQNSEIPLNMIPVISSGTFKVFKSKDMTLIDSFNIEESFMGKSWEDGASSSLISVATISRKKIEKIIENDSVKMKNIKIIFSGIKDLNTLLKIKKGLLALNFGKLQIKSFYDNEAIFIMETGKISGEEISSFIIRSDIIPMQVDYIDKEEIKFALTQKFQLENF